MDSSPNQSGNQSGNNSRNAGRKESIKNKLQHFLGIRQTTNVARENSQSAKSPPLETIVCSVSVLKDIGPESSITQRIKALRDLQKVIQKHKIEKFGIEAIWEAMKDIILTKNFSIENRQEALLFVNYLILSQRDQLEILRLYFFRFIKEKLTDSMDMPYRLEMLKALTNCGKDVSYFQEEIGPFLCILTKDIISLGKAHNFLQFVANIFRFNSCCLDDNEVENILSQICYLCRLTENPVNLKEGLNVLDAVIRYSSVPSNALEDLVAVLCRVVNLKDFANSSWQIMRNLIGSHLGHSSIYTMCCVLQNSDNYQDINLLRGAVSFIGICLWGQRSVEAMKYSSTSVLPSFLQVLNCNQPIVAYEIAISIQRLIKKYSSNLQVVTWDILLDIIESLVRYCQDSQLSDERLTAVTHDILTHIEQIYESNSYNGPTKKLFAILEANSDTRPTSSVLVQISYHSQYLHPTTDNWLGKLAAMMDKYFKFDVRTEIRCKMLSVLFDIYRMHQSIYEEEIIGDIVGPCLLQCVIDERDHGVRVVVINFLIDIIVNSNARIRSDVINTMECIVCTYLRIDTSAVVEDGEMLLQDVNLAIVGLIDAFKELFLRQPPEFAQKIYNILLDHLLLHYQRKFNGQTACQLRCTVFKWLLQLRINHRGSVGVMKTVEGRDIVQFSPYLLFQVDENIDREEVIDATQADHRYELWKVAKISYAKATNAILHCLETERDWAVLIIVLKNMEQLLQYKELILSGKNLNSICRSLHLMINDNEMFFRRIQGVPYGVSMEDFRACVSCVLEVIICYHKRLDVSTQSALVKCFENGLGQKRADLCVRSLTLCLLEMPDVTLKQVPALLRIFASLEHSTSVAQAILEFFSALTTCRYSYSNLSEDDYMNIIATLVPLANPYSYAHFIAILSYHVILNWFAKCNIHVRQALAGNLMNALQIERHQQSTDSSSSSVRRSTSLRQMDDALIAGHISRDNRPRSVTVNVSNVSNTMVPLTVATESYKNPATKGNLSVSKARQLHQEMTEISLDFICRVTFASYSPTCSKRSQSMEMLLRDGLSQTYIINGSVVTITTSRASPLTTDISTASKDDKQSFISEQNRQQGTSDISPSSTIDAFGYESQDTGYRKNLSCSCAEIVIRRATGNVSWVIQTNNKLSEQPFHRELNEILCENDIFTMKRGSGLKNRTTELPELTELTKVNDFRQGSQSERRFNKIREVEEHQIPDKTTDIEKKFQQMTDPNVSNNAASRLGRQSVSSSNSFDDYSSIDLSVKSSSYDQLSGRLQQLQPDSDNQIFLGESSSDHISVNMMKEDVKGDTAGRAKSLDNERPNKLPVDDACLNKSSIILNEDASEENAAIVEENPTYTKTKSAQIRQSLRTKEDLHNELTPSYVLFHILQLPIVGMDYSNITVVPNVEVLNRAINQIDRIPPFSTHKIGLVYVDKGQENNEQAILKNTFGSKNYQNFLNELSDLIDLQNPSTLHIYTGGLDRSGADGNFACAWQDATTQVIFHVATLMPNKETDSSCRGKKMHIGNDFVTIVYDDSDAGYQFETVTGQFNFVEIVIRSISHGLNTIMVHVKNECKAAVEEFNLRQQLVISDASLANIVRQMAIQYNMLATLVYNNPQAAVMSYTLNWVERLRRIKKLNDQTAEIERSKVSPPMGDIPQQDIDANVTKSVTCSKVLLKTLSKNSVIRK
ncbi:Tuberin [Trichoplax sp. H2]|nr:Tuberin [Trichoplax sp. H2]|eukprot:RDD40630.1 Tuberin [Trichoplax sp. H2]